MAEPTQDFRSPLSRAKGMGASKHAVPHWWLQRVTAVALAILLPLFVASLLANMLSPDVGEVANWFDSPLHSLLVVLLLVAIFWHAKLGFQVVIEDYVKCPVAKFALLIANNFVAFVAAALGIMAVLSMHFIDINSFGA